MILRVVGEARRGAAADSRDVPHRVVGEALIVQRRPVGLFGRKLAHQRRRRAAESRQIAVAVGHQRVAVVVQLLHAAQPLKPVVAQIPGRVRRGRLCQRSVVGRIGICVIMRIPGSAVPVRIHRAMVIAEPVRRVA